MDMRLLLKLVNARIDELGMTEREASMRATGSADTIRNWRRRLKKGESFGATTDKVELVCRELGIDMATLTAAPDAGTPGGMAEDAVPLLIADTRRDPVIIALAPNSTTPEVFVSKRDFPAFAIRAGDRLIADMARAPQPGEIVVASQIDQSDGTSTWMVCRWLPPHVLPGGISDDLILIEAGGTMVVARGVIIASFRAEQSQPGHGSPN